MQLSSIKETCLYISNIDHSREFYHDKLGLEIIAEVDNRHIFFRVGQDVLLCFIAETTKNETRLPPHFASGKQHMAFEVPIEEYEDCKEELTNNGIQITHEHEWRENCKSFYFEDPDNNVLEIVTPGLWD